MKKIVVLVHGWGGSPKKDFHPWLKKELEKRDIEVFTPLMPNTYHPNIKKWIYKLKKTIKPNENVYFIGHSIGCQAILRFIESLPKNSKVGGVVFVAGWFHLKPAAFEEEGDYNAAKPWINKKINFNKILKHTKKFTAIFSSDDPYVPLKDSEIFKNKIYAKIIIQKNKGHFGSEDNIKKVPQIIKELLLLLK